MTGNHVVHLTNNHVRAVEISRQTCSFVPQRIKNFFPNLELLQIQNSRLKVITQGDLKPFSKLRVVHMAANQLTNLDNNLFDFNPNLVRVDFKHQHFKTIGYNIFDGLERLALADFISSGCLNFNAQNGRKGIEQVKKEIRINCQPISELALDLKILMEKVEHLEANGINEAKSMKLIDVDSEPIYKKLDAKYMKMQEDNAKCVENFGVLTKNFHALTDKIETLEAALKLQPKDNCEIFEISTQKCLVEKEKLERFKREMSVVDIECERSDWTKVKLDGDRRSCSVKNLKITQPEIRVGKIKSGHQNIEAESVEELKAFNEQVIFLPLVGDNFLNLKALSFVECSLISIGDSSLRDMKKLQSLVLARNEIRNVSAEELKSLTSLSLLDLSHNKIKTLSTTIFRTLPELVTLKLNDNQLYELPPNTFVRQTKMKFLFLQNNKLVLIAVNILEPVKRLELADFSNNECIDVASSRDSEVPLKSLKTVFDENCVNIIVV